MVCGIVAAVAGHNVVPVLIEGLKKLEYRGYDPAGIAVIGRGSIECVRSVGRVAELETESARTAAVTGIAHTRWATHGVPSERNTHPHVSGSIAVVPNGIIENCESLRAELTAQGYVFTSDTDTDTDTDTYPASELKHGPLALVDAETPVISVAPNDQLLDKPKSNFKEVQARGGELYIFADADRHTPESEGVHLGAENKKQLWAPEGFADGFVALHDTAEFPYKAIDYYAPEFERSLLWNDPDLGIKWPIDIEPKRAAKDVTALTLNQAEVSTKDLCV